MFLKQSLYSYGGSDNKYFCASLTPGKKSTDTTKGPHSYEIYRPDLKPCLKTSSSRFWNLVQGREFLVIEKLGIALRKSIIKKLSGAEYGSFLFGYDKIKYSRAAPVALFHDQKGNMYLKNKSNRFRLIQLSKKGFIEIAKKPLRRLPENVEMKKVPFYNLRKSLIILVIGEEKTISYKKGYITFFSAPYLSPKFRKLLNPQGSNLIIHVDSSYTEPRGPVNRGAQIAFKHLLYIFTVPLDIISFPLQIPYWLSIIAASGAPR